MAFSHINHPAMGGTPHFRKPPHVKQWNLWTSPHCTWWVANQSHSRPVLYARCPRNRDHPPVADQLHQRSQLGTKNCRILPSSSWSAVVQPYCQASSSKYIETSEQVMFLCSHTSSWIRLGIPPPCKTQTKSKSSWCYWSHCELSLSVKSSPTWSLILMITWTSPFCTSTASQHLTAKLTTRSNLLDPTNLAHHLESTWID